MKKFTALFLLFFFVSSQAAYATNDFYNASGAPSTGASLSSATMRAEFSSIEDGFDGLPSLSGNSELPIFVNTGETALEAISTATALSRLGAEASVNKDATGGYVGLTTFNHNFKDTTGTYTSYFTNSNTASRTYTFPDSAGTIKLTTDAPAAHTVASHSDTTATGAELETLTDDSMADTLHRHSELSASDGTPNQSLVSGADGNLTIGTGLTLTYTDGGASVDEFSTDGTLAGNSDTALPTEKAVKTYVDTEISASSTTADEIIPFAHYQDQKTKGTSGGNSSLGNNDRDINTEITDTEDIGVLNSNEIELAAGTYYIQCESSVWGGASAGESARNVIRKSDNTVLLVGPSIAVYYGGIVSVSGNITLASTASIKVTTYTADAELDGLGLDTNQDPYEVYTDLKIWKRN